MWILQRQCLVDTITKENGDRKSQENFKTNQETSTRVPSRELTWGNATVGEQASPSILQEPAVEHRKAQISWVKIPGGEH